MPQLSKHFRREEFHCTGCTPANPCWRGGWDTVDAELVEILEKVRAFFEAPVLVSSGHRCPERNRAVGGVENSQHLLGRAADIKVVGIDPDQVWDFLRPWHEGGLGVYDSFVHVDTRSDGPERWDRRSKRMG